MSVDYTQSWNCRLFQSSFQIPSRQPFSHLNRLCCLWSLLQAALKCLQFGFKWLFSTQPLQLRLSSLSHVYTYPEEQNPSFCRADRARNPKAYIPSARYRSDQFCNYPRSFEVKRGRRIDPTGAPSSLLRLIMSLLLRERLKTMHKTIACILSPTLTMGTKNFSGQYNSCITGSGLQLQEYIIMVVGNSNL